MKKPTMVAVLAAFSVLVIAACAPSEDAADGSEAAAGTAEGPNPTKNAYFGDLHVHTRSTSRASPTTACTWGCCRR